MRITGIDKLEEFRKKHPDTRNWVSSWVAETKESNWKRPKDIKDRYASASILSENVIVFDVKGNNYRLAVQIDYISKIVLVLFAGTHCEYDLWNRKRR